MVVSQTAFEYTKKKHSKSSQVSFEATPHG